ncbi:MAG: ATP-dependent DNA helicase RecG, partial [Coriobacteriia bacterium]|nr:ATP-dependent DNA helicase RecG [Coriobacteriia bacterium]
MAPSPYKNEGKAVPGLVRDRLSATLSLNAPVSSLEGVGPKRARALGLRGIQSLRDLLDCYPRRYVDMSCVRSVAEARIGEQCTVVGMVHSVTSRKTRQRNLSLVEIGVLDASGILMVTCFNQPWLARKLVSGMRVSVSGKIEFNYGFKRMTSPIIVVLEPEDEAGGVVLPLHPASAEVPRTMMARLVSGALSKVRGCIDPLPASLRARYRLCSRYQAWRAIHEPETPADIAMARRRLIYEELLLLELGLMARSRNRRPGTSPYAQVTKGPRLDALRRALPFALTDEQEAAVADILARMADSSCMDHLLLGDVGTGKTAVALFALVAAAEGGHQALMMGPTEVLVRQYARSVGSLLDEAGVTWAILTGTTPAAERMDVLGRFSEGSLDVLLGTHALLSDDVRPKDCSVVVIDEQQRFGVEQRGALVAKAPDSDVLSMTATPIPRSLALALYGDLTLSYLTCRPQALSPLITKVCHFEEEGRAYDAIREALSRGEQAYIVCPLIGVATEALRPSDYEVEEEPGADSVVEYAFVEGLLEQGDFDPAGKVVSAATTHARILSESVFPEARVALLHGRLAADEKAQIMQDFAAGDIDILVSTTVVEVGVDVPNATVMVVEDADRFGLAQLHQLRGRVGRGAKAASVFLISRSRAPEALARLKAMEDVDDGFELSERDLALRREGDVFGGRQHGASRLKLVNVV